MGEFIKSIISISLVLGTPTVVIADPQDAISDVRNFSSTLSDYVVTAGPLVDDCAEAAKIKRSLNQMLDMLEKALQM